MNIMHTVIPAAGLGTRFLPYTKAVPKELLPIGAKPAIQLIIEEALKSGVNQVSIIANHDKQAIKDYFSYNPFLEKHLKKVGKEEKLNELNAIIENTSFTYIPQEDPLGLGHAVLQAKNFIGDNYFGVMLPDEIMHSEKPCLLQLIEKAQKYNASIIAVQEVPHERVSSYGIVKYKKAIDENLFEVEDLIEKPLKEDAPSNLAIIGRYVLSPAVFTALENTSAGAGNEIQLTDGIKQILLKGERVLAYKLDGVRHDIGNPVGWLEANMFYGFLSGNIPKSS